MTAFDFLRQPGLARETCFLAPDSPPRISIVTPYYEAWSKFRQTFFSVRAQTFPFWEWIIIDDGSKSDVRELESFLSEEPRIRLIRQDNNGPAAARNLGLAHVRAELVVLLDADDLLERTFLECAYWTMQTHPKADWAYCDTVAFGAEEYLWHPPFSAGWLRVRNDLVMTACVRREAIQRINGFCTDPGCGYEDWIFWLDMIRQGSTPVHMSWHGFWYRRSFAGRLNGARAEHAVAMRQVKERTTQPLRRRKAVEYPRWENATVPVWRRPGDEDLPILAEYAAGVLIVVEQGSVRADKAVSDFCTRQHGRGVWTGILSISPLSPKRRQCWDGLADEVYELAAFLDRADWPAFIAHYIATRNVSRIFVTGKTLRKQVGPWLAKEFQNVEGIGNHKSTLYKDAKKRAGRYFTHLTAAVTLRIGASRLRRYGTIRALLIRSGLGEVALRRIGR